MKYDALSSMGSPGHHPRARGLRNEPSPGQGQFEWTPFSPGLLLNMLLTVAFNAVPLWGVVARGWNVFSIVFVYWAENLIVGLFNVWKLRLIARHGPSRGSSLAGFFALHYGGFCLVHGILLAVFFWEPRIPWGDIGLGFLALLASHGVSFFYGFLRPGEFRRADPGLQMFAPYPRIVIIHLTVIFGAILSGMMGDSMVVLQVMVAVKIAIELVLLLLRLRQLEPAAGR